MKNMFYEKRIEESCTYIFSPLSKRIPKKGFSAQQPQPAAAAAKILVII